ncbi:hypothetical protein [Streptosporangium sp. 'caverna']|uniref:hypothetical protein n=1 Tax=Streptosporangium sp. 'caverna' TaxID=2202249 RepID=UPI000D7DFAEF|nr:hypothetical protein [Streptosporangium sp. 'caverna']AWS43113.1 hypothetical protein DKM19_18760 [Streptosporangium sp. 'caverna']
MTFLIVAVVLVGALCMFNLLLTFAVLRRLREHTTELERLAGQEQFAPYDPSVLVGRALPGAGADDADRPRLVAFFDVDCSTCHERAPQFVAAARDHAGAALAVITGDGRKVDDLAGLVGGVSKVVTAEGADSMVRALGIEAFPTFLRVGPDGTVVDAQTELEMLAGTAPVA